MNVAKENLDNVLALIPSLKNPTVSNLSGSDWFAVETVIDELQVRDLIPQLKQVGAEGFIEFPLNKVIY